MESSFSLEKVFGKPAEEKRAVMSILESLMKKTEDKKEDGEKFILLEREARRGGECIIGYLADIVEQDEDEFRKIVSCIFANINKVSVTRLIFSTVVSVAIDPALRVKMLSHMGEISRELYPGNREKLEKKLGLAEESKLRAFYPAAQ